jgi:phosphatidylinositol alpha-1,6-mannosyltransferase
MRALVLSENFPPKIGGSGRHLWELYRRMPTDRYVIAAGEDPGQESFDSTHDLDVHRLPLTFPTRFLRPASLPGYQHAFAEVRRLVRDKGVTCVHAGRTIPEGLLAWALLRSTGVPYVCYAHGEEINLSNPEPSPAWYRRAVYGSRELALLVGLVLRNASAMIVSSHNASRILRERWGLPAERIRLLHPAVDTTRFRPAPRDAAVRRRLGWGDRPVVLTVGRLQKRKGQDVMISALPALRREVPAILYAVVGSGEERESLERLAAELRVESSVQFLDELSDDELIECYQQCDLFALPNREIGGDIEGIGIVLLEAQSVGKPVIAGASGGTRETMRIPHTGLVVPCEGPEELTREIASMLQDPPRLERMGREGREWITATFDLQIRSRQMDELFNDTGLCAAGA